jgi:hypothetical protein
MIRAFSTGVRTPYPRISRFENRFAAGLLLGVVVVEAAYLLYRVLSRVDR